MTKKEVTFSLKDQLFNKEKVEYLAGCIKSVYSNFDDEKFTKEIVDKFPELELKERIIYITSMLKKYLPDEYYKAIGILLKSLPDEVIHEIEDDNFGDFIFCPYSQYVATYGCDNKYLELSLNALEQMTTRFSAEDSIRSFINDFENETFKKIFEWSKADNYHLRRLASEGTRPKLPWCKKINSDYKKTIPILDNLYTDTSRFVTRSVANHLNDISKIEPELVVKTLDKWKKSKKGDDLDYIISHGTRTLVKLGDKGTLEFLGYSSNPKIKVKNFNINNDNIQIGESLEFEFEINPSQISLSSGRLDTYQGRSSYKEKLIIDYKIYFVGKNGKLLPKVFKIKKIILQKETYISKKHPLKLMTTKALYPGKHFLELMINGNSFGKKEFELK